MASESLTEYEQKRLQNIKRNDEMLAALQIQSKASNLYAFSKRQRLESRVCKEKKTEPNSTIVMRRSLRIRGMEPDFKVLNEAFVDSGDKTSEKCSKTPPVMIGPLSFKEAYTGTESHSGTPIVDAILSVSKQSHKDKDYTIMDTEMKFQVGCSVEEFDENLSEKCDLGSPVKEKIDGSNACKDEDSSEKHDIGSCDMIKGVVKTLKSGTVSCFDPGSFTLKRENVARLFVSGTLTAVKLFPSSEVRIVVAGSDDATVGLWNLGSEQEKEENIYLYRTHTGVVTAIVVQQFSLSKVLPGTELLNFSFSPCSIDSNASQIFTSCNGGLIRLMDAEKEVFDLIYTSKDSIYHLSQQQNNVNSLFFSKGEGRLNIWDVRAGKSSSEWLLHELRINTIDFNVQNPNIMATSSTDCTACLWDLRSMASDKPKPLKIISHKRAVHSAFFSPSGSSLATTSKNHKICIWNGVNFEDTCIIHHQNTKGGKSALRAIWGWDDSYILSNLNRGVHVISLVDGKRMTFRSSYMSSIPYRMHAHPYEVGMLAGATTGGLVYVLTSG